MQKSTMTGAAVGIKFEESAAGMVQGLSFVTEEVKHCKAALASELKLLAERGYGPLLKKRSEQQYADWQRVKSYLLPFLETEVLPRFEQLRADVEETCNYVQVTLQGLMPHSQLVPDLQAASSADPPVS